MKNIFKVFGILLGALTLSGCTARHVVTPEEMKREMSAFELPQSPQPDQATVYFTYETIKKHPLYNDGIEILYAKSTKKKYENDHSQGHTILNIFTLGLLEDSRSTKTTLLGLISPFEYKVFYFEPGYYEFTGRLLTENKLVASDRLIQQVKLEKGETYYLKIFGSSFFNRYSNTFEHGYYMTEVQDKLKGKYLVFKKTQPQK